jgi:hypothetical protein
VFDCAGHIRELIFGEPNEVWATSHALVGHGAFRDSFKRVVRDFITKRSKLYLSVCPLLSHNVVKGISVFAVRAKRVMVVASSLLNVSPKRCGVIAIVNPLILKGSVELAIAK